MKKIVPLVFLTFLSNSLFAAPLMMDSQWKFWFLLSKNDYVYLDNSRQEVPPFKGWESGYKLPKYTPLIEDMGMSPEVIKVSKASGTLNSDLVSVNYQQDIDLGYKGQCVSFVKAVTGSRVSTSNWSEGAAVTAAAPPAIGSVIATFNSNGSYDHQHTAVVLSTRSNGLIVVDQNWTTSDGGWGGPGTDKGVVSIHFLEYNSSAGGVNDALNYSVVNID